MSTEPQVSGAPSGPPGGAFWWCFAGCGLLAVLPVWLFPYLPMVDLPQHAGQIALAQRFDDASFAYRELFERNRFAPNVTAVVLVRALARVVEIDTAFRLLLTVALLATPLVLVAWLRRLGASAWGALLSFAVGFGNAFSWGFVNFVIGIPAALFFLLVVARHAERARFGTGVTSFGLGILLFLTHPMIYAPAGLAAAAMVVLRRASLREVSVRLLPLVLTVPLAALWVHTMRESEQQTHIATVWNLGRVRLVNFASEATGARPRAAEQLLALLVFVAPFLAGARFCRVPWRYGPLLVFAGCYLLAPFAVLGTGAVYPRFAAMVLPTLLLALDDRAGPAPGKAARTRSRRRLLMPLVAGAWLLALWPRFWGVQHEARGLERMLARTESGKRLLYLPLDPYSAFWKAPVFLHAGMWYQVRRGGLTDFSFAQFFPNHFRYRRDRPPPLPTGFEWWPERFHWRRHGGDNYDYFLVRVPEDVGARLFRTAPRPIALVARDGPWWLYRPLDQR